MLPGLMTTRQHQPALLVLPGLMTTGQHQPALEETER